MQVLTPTLQPLAWGWVAVLQREVAMPPLSLKQHSVWRHAYCLLHNFFPIEVLVLVQLLCSSLLLSCRVLLPRVPPPLASSAKKIGNVHLPLHGLESHSQEHQRARVLLLRCPLHPACGLHAAEWQTPYCSLT